MLNKICNTIELLFSGHHFEWILIFYGHLAVKLCAISLIEYSTLLSRNSSFTAILQLKRSSIVHFLYKWRKEVCIIFRCRLTKNVFGGCLSVQLKHRSTCQEFFTKCYRRFIKITKIIRVSWCHLYFLFSSSSFSLARTVAPLSLSLSRTPHVPPVVLYRGASSRSNDRNFSLYSSVT